MSSFQLDPTTGDLLITNNSLTLTTGIEAIRQHMQCRFRLFLGEWFLDTTLGVPWFRDILIKRPAFVVVREILKKVILETPGVLEILKFEFDFVGQTRTAKLVFAALTTEGVIDYTQLVET